MLVYALPTEAIAGQRFPIALAVILFEDQVAMPGHQKAAVLAASGGVVEGPIELLQIHARGLADLRGVFQRAPPTLGIGRRKVILRTDGERQEAKEQEYATHHYD